MVPFVVVVSLVITISASLLELEVEVLAVSLAAFSDTWESFSLAVLSNMLLGALIE